MTNPGIERIYDALAKAKYDRQTDGRQSDPCVFLFALLSQQQEETAKDLKARLHSKFRNLNRKVN